MSLPPRTPIRTPSFASSVDADLHRDYHLAPEPSHPAPPSPAFTNSTIYRTPDESYSDAETDLGDGIATPVTLSGADGGSPRPSQESLRYEDLPPSYEEAQADGQRVAYHHQQHPHHQQNAVPTGTNMHSPLSPPPPFAQSVSGLSNNSSDPVLPAVERLVLREKERAASEHDELSSRSGGGDDAVAAANRHGLSFAAIEGLASEHHGALEVALQWAHPAYHAGDAKEPVAPPGGLARPVVVPQVNPAPPPPPDQSDDADEGEGALVPAGGILSFARAYAQTLHIHGIPAHIFLAFLDGLNAVCHAARAPATDIYDESAPEPDLSLVESYLARANALYFAQRGIVVRVVDVDGLLDDVLRISAGRRSLRDALARDVEMEGASERERVEALDPWVERLVWEGLPPQMLGWGDLRGRRGREEGEGDQEQQQQQHHNEQGTGILGGAGNTGFPAAAAAAPASTFAPPAAPAATTTTTTAYANGEFYNTPEGVAGGYLDEKAQARSWDSQYQQQPHAHDTNNNETGPSSSSSSNNRPHDNSFFPPNILPPLPGMSNFPGLGSFPPAPPPPFGDHARWADWGQGLGRRWADWGQQFGQNWANWGQEVGNRAAAWGRATATVTAHGAGGLHGRGGGGTFGRMGSWCVGDGRGGAGGGFAGRGPFLCGRGGPAGTGFGQPYPFFPGPWARAGGFGFAGRGLGGRGGGRGFGRGGGHELRGGWWNEGGNGSAGAGGPNGQYGTFGPSSPTVLDHDGGNGDATTSRNVHPPLNHSSTTLDTNPSRISLEDNDIDDSLSSSSDDDDDGGASDTGSISCAFDAIEVAYLKRVRSINSAADEALAKGKRSRADVERDRDRALEKAKADREKAARKRDGKRKKAEAKRTIKALKREWRGRIKEAGKGADLEETGDGSGEGSGSAAAAAAAGKKKERKEAVKQAMKVEEQRLKREFAEAKQLWWEGYKAERGKEERAADRAERREERREERKENRRERREGRRSGGGRHRGGGGGGGRCGARERDGTSSQDRGLEVGVVANEEGARAGASAESLAPPQLLWVVVENLEN